MKKGNSGTIISQQFDSEEINVEEVFRHYKFAIAEHPPIKLSTGKWLHSYRVSYYNDQVHGDPETEEEAFNYEIYGN